MTRKKNSLMIKDQDSAINKKNNSAKNTKAKKQILSASRRTDIPAFYLEWFIKRIRKGSFEIKNPYNKITKTVDSNPDKIHTIVFWSKNYELFLKTSTYKELKEMGYELFFHFSINSESPMLEPSLPPLEERLVQLERLCEINGPKTITWRFDPICFYKTSSGLMENNLSDFVNITEKAAELGISRCATSFADNYRKVERRIKFLKNKGKDVPVLVEVDIKKRIDIIKRMSSLLGQKGIELFLCSERDLYSSLDNKTNINESACISGKYLAEIFKGDPELKRDYGQRANLGCNCSKSIDIGSYKHHPCYHNCLFCYANPAIDQEMKKVVTNEDRQS